MIQERQKYDLITESIRVIRRIQREIILPKENVFELDLQFRRIIVTSSDKTVLQVDLDAESRFRQELAASHGNVIVLGEESLDVDLSIHADLWTEQNKVFALVDMVDGTDLLEMGISLWCSAVVFLDFREGGKPRILGAAVIMANGDAYYAVDGEKNAFVMRGMENYVEKKCIGPSTIGKFSEAYISFYGQKAKSFLSVAEHPGFSRAIGALSKGAGFRIYNFDGNPIMAKLVDRNRSGAGIVVGGGIDAVISVQGQQMHDFVPGVFIAVQGGAHLCNLDGNEVSISELAQKLLKPRGRMQYILAATKQLADEIVAIAKSA